MDVEFRFGISCAFLLIYYAAVPQTVEAHVFSWLTGLSEERERWGERERDEGASEQCEPIYTSREEREGLLRVCRAMHSRLTRHHITLTLTFNHYMEIPGLREGTWKAWNNEPILPHPCYMSVTLLQNAKNCVISVCWWQLVSCNLAVIRPLRCCVRVTLMFSRQVACWTIWTPKARTALTFCLDTKAMFNFHLEETCKVALSLQIKQDSGNLPQ